MKNDFLKFLENSEHFFKNLQKEIDKLTETFRSFIDALEELAERYQISDTKTGNTRSTKRVRYIYIFPSIKALRTLSKKEKHWFAAVFGHYIFSYAKNKSAN